MPRGNIKGDRPARNHQPCKVCGEPVETIRSDAITCSNRCRQVRKRFVALMKSVDALQSRRVQSRAKAMTALEALLRSQLAGLS